jgi:hypothetical protein
MLRLVGGLALAGCKLGVYLQCGCEEGLRTELALEANKTRGRRLVGEQRWRKRRSSREMI